MHTVITRKGLLTTVFLALFTVAIAASYDRWFCSYCSMDMTALDELSGPITFHTFHGQQRRQPMAAWRYSHHHQRVTVDYIPLQRLSHPALGSDQLWRWRRSGHTQKP
ncbi:conserved protein of unknown function [Ectopseudomonas oleovorans]|uniref:Uncharacterized protein n=1 Tax=Ectopseudomonas oleovorans TaxID=301 RepID=A0A653B2Y6_ECTOL|nr:conserved protein of unknown function [Pseudomonas oleovorans]